MKTAPSTTGFSLLEALIAVCVIGIVAVVTVPVLASRDPVRLQTAATEVGNAMRFALSEAARSGGYVLIDAATPGRLRLVSSNAGGADLGTVQDPLTKRAMEIDATAPPWAGQLAMTPQFFQGGTAYGQLLVSPGGGLQVFDGGVNRGALQSGSGVLVAVGGMSATVAIAETTGRITLP